MRKKKEYITIVLVYLIQLYIFIPLSLERLVARDEGFYAYAAKLISQGRIPYLDFFFPQMPLSAYVWSLWMQLAGTTWVSARILAALLTAAIGLIMFVHVQRILGKLYPYLALILFCGSNFVFPWFLVVQTYSLSTLCLFCSYYLLYPEDGSRKNLPIFFAGFFLGLAIDTRLFFAGLAPFLALYLFITTKQLSSRLRLSGLFTLGTLVALSPNLYFMLKDYDVFYYNNLGYHLTRSSLSPEDDAIKKMTLLQIVLGFRETAKFTAFQFPLLLYLSIVSFISAISEKKSLDCSFLIVGVLFFLNFIPSPSYLQYFCSLAPFLIITSLYGMKEILVFQDNSRSLTSKCFAYLLLIIICIYYFEGYKTDLDNYTRTGNGVIGINQEKNAKNWTLERVEVINIKLGWFTRPEDKIIAFWPGYFLSNFRSVYPGFENHFREIASRTLTVEEQERYKVPSKYTARALIDTQQIDLVVFNENPRRRGIKKALTLGEYEILAAEPPVNFYKKPNTTD